MLSQKHASVHQHKHGRFPNIKYYNASLGFEEFGGEIILVEKAEFEQMDLSKHSMTVGEFPVMLAAFSTLIPDERFAGMS